MGHDKNNETNVMDNSMNGFSHLSAVLRNNTDPLWSLPKKGILPNTCFDQTGKIRQVLSCLDLSADVF